MISNSGFIHKGLKLYWDSGGENHSKIPPHLAKVIDIILAHLDAAQSLADIKGGIAQHKDVKLLSGHTDRYSMHVNGPLCITFTCEDDNTGLVSKIDLEDYHRPGGAKKH